MSDQSIPDFFVYGEPARSLSVGFMHVESVMDRSTVHQGNVAPHRHPQLGQLTFWFSGAGTYRIEDRVWHFSAPTVSFVPSGVVHGFAIEPQADAIVVSIADGMLASLAGQTLLPLDRPVLVSGRPNDPTWPRLSQVLDLIVEEYRVAQPESEKVMAPLIAAALSFVARLSTETELAEEQPQTHLAYGLRRAVDLNFRQDWAVADYVRELGTTPHLLDKAARQVLGMSVKELVIERRLLEAKRLLLFTIRSVEDIGYEIGFKDAAYFSRFFRLRTGEAPAAWRRRELERKESPPEVG